MGPIVFDRRIVRLHRARAAGTIARHDAIPREVAARLADRLGDMARDFALALDLGGRSTASGADGPAAIATLVRTDLSAESLAATAPDRTAARVVADEEGLPFAEGVFDLVLSCLVLHWTNDLPGALSQIRRALKPDGLFLAALFGGETLRELRLALMDAEIAEEGGASPRVSPFVDAREAGALLQRAGFALPVVDVDTLRVTYPDAMALMRELSGMGESNAVAARRKSFTRRRTLARAAALYAERHGGPDGRVEATFQAVYLTGWRPHESQQRALSPGSAAKRLADALGAEEIAAGAPAMPGQDKGDKGKIR